MEKFANTYETMMLLSSYSEEIKLYLQRLYVRPLKNSWKLIFLNNEYDTDEKFKEEIEILIENYSKITEALNDYPEWQQKFKQDINKQLSYANIQQNHPEIFKVIDQHRAFK